MRKVPWYAMVLVGLFALTGCEEGEDAVRAALNDCFQSDLLGDDLLYMGTSSNVGAGTVFRKRGTSYELRALAPSEWDDGVVYAHAWSACEHGHGTTFNLSGGGSANLISNGLGVIDPKIVAGLKKASSVRLSARNWRQVDLVGGSFEVYYEDLPEDSLYRRVIEKGDALVVFRAFEIKGFTAEYTLDKATAVEVQAALTESQNENVGDVSAGLDFEVISGNILKVESKDTIIPFVRLGYFGPGAVAAPSDAGATPSSDVGSRGPTEESIQWHKVQRGAVVKDGR